MSILGQHIRERPFWKFGSHTKAGSRGWRNGIPSQTRQLSTPHGVYRAQDSRTRGTWHSDSPDRWSQQTRSDRVSKAKIPPHIRGSFRHTWVGVWLFIVPIVCSLVHHVGVLFHGQSDIVAHMRRQCVCSHFLSSNHVKQCVALLQLGTESRVAFEGHSSYRR